MSKSAKSASTSAKAVLKLATVKPFLVPPRVDKNCVDTLRELLEQAEAGEIIGYAIAVMYRTRSYYVDALGEADKNPTFARGMIKSLDDFLEEKVGWS
jgi:hypothetical protein